MSQCLCAKVWPLKGRALAQRPASADSFIDHGDLCAERAGYRFWKNIKEKAQLN